MVIYEIVTADRAEGNVRSMQHLFVAGVDH